MQILLFKKKKKKKGASCRLLAQLSVQPVALKCTRMEKHFSDWESSHECSLKPEQQLWQSENILVHELPSCRQREWCAAEEKRERVGHPQQAETIVYFIFTSYFKQTERWLWLSGSSQFGFFHLVTKTGVKISPFLTFWEFPAYSREAIRLSPLAMQSRRHCNSVHLLVFHIMPKLSSLHILLIMLVYVLNENSGPLEDELGFSHLWKSW